MENASKALIIAGAILLVILLISLGILVYNNAKGTIEDANLSEQEIQVFNEKFTQFLGTKKTADDVRNLLQTAIAVDPNSQKIKFYSHNNATNCNKKANCTQKATTYAGKEPFLNKSYTIKAFYTDGLMTGISIYPRIW